MVERVLVPDALPIEDEELTAGHVPEDEAVIEVVSEPHEFVLDGFGVHLLEVLDVHDDLPGLAGEIGLVEDDLLGVRKELGMPAEVRLLSPSPWHEREGDEHRQESDVGASRPGSEGEQYGPVSVAPGDGPRCVLALIQELGVLMKRNSREVGMGIRGARDLLAWSEERPDGPEEESILEQRILAEVVVRSILIWFIVVKTVAQAVRRETCAHPGEEDIVGDVLLRGLVLEVVIVWKLIVSVFGIAAHVLVVAASASSESSNLLSEDHLPIENVKKRTAMDLLTVRMCCICPLRIMCIKFIFKGLIQ